MPRELDGRRVLITGASSGIGEQLALAFARRGAHLALAARRQERLEEVATRCRTARGPAIVLPVDLGDTAAAADLGARALDALGGIDVLINNAGIPRRVHAGRLTFADIDETMRVNYLGAMALTMAVLPAMLEQRSGRIVNIGSIAGRLPAPREGAYAASKHALAAMSECMAIDLRGSGVSVHLVTPGVIDTPLWQVPGQEESPTSGDSRTPPGDVADAVLDLLRTGRFEAYVPARYRLPAVLKPLMGGAFLAGTARFDRRRVPEAHE